VNGVLSVKLKLMGILAVMALSYVGNTQAAIFDASADFSIASNPNGAWSHGYSVALVGPFEPFVLYSVADSTAYGDADLDRWSATSGSGPDDTTYPFIMKNVGSSSKTVLDITVAPGELVFHPGNLNEVSILRWTAPSNGSVDISAIFEGMSTEPSGTTADVHVFHNAVALFSDTINGIPDTQSYSTTGLTVSGGDTLRFLVGAGGNGNISDSTSVAAIIDFTPEVVTPTVPEPGTALLWLLGGACCAIAARRQS
jgi:hypothetical protein